MSQRLYAYCRCFLSQNIFVHKAQAHVTFLNEKQFCEFYSNQFDDYDSILQIVQKEVQRRKDLRNNVLERINKIQLDYKRLHPDVYQFKDDIFQEKVNEIDATHIGSEVYAVPVFKSEFLKKFLQELEHFKSSGIKHEQPNSMNRHGIILDEIGFQPFFDCLRTQFVQPLARILFNDPDMVLDSHKAFVVKYSMNEDLDLAPHFDNCEITLNVALSESKFSL